MKTLLIFLFTFASISAFANFQAAYIDMQKAIQSTKAGKSARTTLEQEFNRKKDELKKKEEQLKKEAEEFEKKRMVLSEQKRNEQQEALQQKMMAFQQELQQSQANIQQKERELTQPILEKIQKVISEVAKKKGYSMIFEKGSQGVMWAKSELDITDEVISAFEKSK
jgi:outer membrane protein